MSAQSSSQPANHPFTQLIQPTGKPSGQPTAQPTAQPSDQPTSLPTGQPSLQPSGQPTGNPTFVKNFNTTNKQFEFGYAGVNAATKDYEGLTTITGIGPAEGNPIYLSMLLWPSGFANGYVKFYAWDDVSFVVLPSAGGTNGVGPQGSCQPDTNIGSATGACVELFFPCQLNIDVTRYVHPEEGGSIRIRTTATGVSESSAAGLPCRKNVTGTQYPLFAKFVVGNRKYGGCDLGKYFQACNGQDPNCETCFDCPAGKYSDLQITSGAGCRSCSAGRWSDAGAPFCKLSEPGSFVSATGVLEKCPVGQYVSTEGATQCTQCAAGKTNAAEGSTDESQCVSIIINFVAAFVALLLCVPLAFHYVLQGRFRRIAFLRKVRVLRLLNTDTHDVTSYLAYITNKMRAERLLKTWRRRFVTWVFILSVPFVALVGVGFSFAGELSEVFFKAMILLKSLNLDVLGLGATIKAFLADLINLIGTQWLHELMSPAVAIIDFLGKFKIDLKQLQVTCEGASAPVELFMNMVILGIVILLTQANFQPYKLLAYDRMVELSNAMFTSKMYTQWFIRLRGQLLGFSFMGVFSYTFRVLSAVLWQLISVIDIFQSALIYMMSMVYVENFVRVGGSAGLSVQSIGMHAYSEACNQIKDFAGVDALLAFGASVLFWFLVPPMIYEIANVVVPGLPPGVENFDVIQLDKEDFQSWFGIHKYLKLFSFGSPDLLWARIASSYIQGMTRDTPSGAGFYVKSIHEVEEDEVEKAAADRKKVLPVAGMIRAAEGIGTKEPSGASNGMVAMSDDIAFQQSTLISSIERPPTPTFCVEVSQRDGYVALFSCTKIIRGTKIFKNVHVDKTITGLKYVMIKLRRSDGEVDPIETYDIYADGLHADGRNGRDLADALNQATDEHVVVVTTAFDSSMNQTENGLPDAIYRCGGSPKVFASQPFMRGYLLVGIPGCGAGKGFEVKYKDEAPELAVEFGVLKSSAGFTINERVSTGRFYLRSAFAERTHEENIEWKVFNNEQMPRYWKLCEMEAGELVNKLAPYCGVSYFMKAICWILAASGLGHCITRLGQRAVYVVLWKYLRYIQVVLGIWTEELVDMYRVHDTVHQYSTVWDDPFEKRHKHFMEEAVANDIGHVQEKSPQDDAASQSHTTARKLEHYEHQRLGLNTVESKKQLKQDYALVLYGLIAPRATFLQLIPYVSMLTIFATFTAGNPVFVFSPSLLANLKPGIAKGCLATSTAIVEEECEKLWQLKQDESSEESYTIPLPTEIDSESEIGSISLAARRQLIQNKNKISRARQQTIVAQGKVLPRQWEAYAAVPSLFLNGSRYLQYAKGVCKCIISILLVAASAESTKLLSLASIIVLLPFSLAAGLDVMIKVGTVLAVTDAELYRELGWLGRLCRWCGHCRSPRAETEETSSESTDKDMSSRHDVGDPVEAAGYEAEAPSETPASTMNPLFAKKARASVLRVSDQFDASVAPAELSEDGPTAVADTPRISDAASPQPPANTSEGDSSDKVTRPFEQSRAEDLAEDSSIARRKDPLTLALEDLAEDSSIARRKEFFINKAGGDSKSVQKAEAEAEAEAAVDSSSARSTASLQKETAGMPLQTKVPWNQLGGGAKKLAASTSRAATARNRSSPDELKKETEDRQDLL